MLLPSGRRPQRDLQEDEKGSTTRDALWADAKGPQCIGIGTDTAASDSDEYVGVPPFFTTPMSLFLIKLRLLRTASLTVSQSELLALCRLAKARTFLRETSRDALAVASPGEATSSSEEVPAEGPCQHRQGPYRKQQLNGKRRRIRVDPLDVCSLLVSGELEVSDLALLGELDEVAEEAEMAQQRKARWCWWAWLLRWHRARGHIWEAAAAKLQQAVAPLFTDVSSRRNRKSIDLTEDGVPSDSLLTSNIDVVPGKTLGLSEDAKRGPFGAPLPSSISPRGLHLGPPPSAAAITETEAAQDPPTRLSAGSTFRGPMGGTLCHPMEETGGDGEAAVKAAAATISRLGSDSLALLPHCCKWPLAVAAKSRGSPGAELDALHPWSLQGATQDASEMHFSEPSGTVFPSDGWKAAVGFRVRRSRVGSRRRREIARRRQRLSPLDPPYDANALFLHPFSVAASVDLPDMEATRASEVHEVSLDFLSRCKATQACPQCNRAETPSKTASERGEYGFLPPPRCPLHQRMHYKKVGEIQ